VVAAYSAANRISVLSDYPCYYHISRADHGNAGYRPLDPASYLKNLAEALDIVDSNTEPGPSRDRPHRRWLRSEIVGRLRGGKLLQSAEDFRVDFVREARSLVIARFSAGVDAGLSPRERLVACLLRIGDLTALLRLADWENNLQFSARLLGAMWRDGALVLEVEAALADGESNPVELSEQGRSLILMPPYQRPCEMSCR
jgi:hypothetical protein